MQPGQTIKPNSRGDLPPPPSDDSPLPEPQEPEQPDSPREPHEPDAPETNWDFQGSGHLESTTPNAVTTAKDGLVKWTASEYIDHEKRAGWFVLLSTGALVVAVILYLITKDLFITIITLIAAGLFGITAARKPRTLEYELNNVGIRIENKHYPYSNFKSFSVMEEDAFSSVQLIPLKRLMPPLSLYYPPDHEGIVLRVLSDFLPHEDRTQDAIDRLMRRVRF